MNSQSHKIEVVNLIPGEESLETIVRHLAMMAARCPYCEVDLISLDEHALWCPDR